MPELDPGHLHPPVQSHTVLHLQKLKSCFFTEKSYSPSWPVPGSRSGFSYNKIESLQLKFLYLKQKLFVPEFAFFSPPAAYCFILVKTAPQTAYYSSRRDQLHSKTRLLQLLLVSCILFP